MSTFDEREELQRLRRELLVAAVEEHRLHQVANREREAEHRWKGRADLARTHQHESLAAEALARSDLHRQRADQLGIGMPEGVHRDARTEVQVSLAILGEKVRALAADEGDIRPIVGGKQSREHEKQSPYSVGIVK